MLGREEWGASRTALGTRQAADTGKSTRCVIRNRAASLQFGLMSVAGGQKTTRKVEHRKIMR